MKLSIDKLIPFPNTDVEPDVEFIIELAANKLLTKATQRNKLKDKENKFPQ